MPSSTQPNRRPLCPLHPHSAGEIIHRSGRESTTSTTTATRPVRATPNSGPRWKPAAGPSGNSSHHTHDQTAHAPAGRPVHAAPVLVMGKPPADIAQHAQQPHPDRPQISQPEPPHPRRRASEARHSIRHTARHFFKSKAQTRHILAISHPLQNRKAHDSRRIFNGQSWVSFGALEGTRIPGPLIKSQMLYRLSYERIFLQ